VPGGIYDRMEEAVSADPVGGGNYGPSSIPWKPADSGWHRGRHCCGSDAWPAVRPTDRPLEVNDTRMSGDEFEISYPFSRDASALRQT
jgi:hypothetical protein